MYAVPSAETRTSMCGLSTNSRAVGGVHQKQASDETIGSVLPMGLAGDFVPAMLPPSWQQRMNRWRARQESNL
jgi:hypothetical protein